MKSITTRLQQLETINKSKRTPKEKETLTKAAKGEITWTPEIQNLYLEAVKDNEKIE